MKLTENIAAVEAERGARELTNLKISLFDRHGDEMSADIYAKVTEKVTDAPPMFIMTFTSVPPEAKAFLEEQRG